MSTSRGEALDERQHDSTSEHIDHTELGSSRNSRDGAHCLRVPRDGRTDLPSRRFETLAGRIGMGTVTAPADELLPSCGHR
jgi:hypothetical protein